MIPVKQKNQKLQAHRYSARYQLNSGALKLSINKGTTVWFDRAIGISISTVYQDTLEGYINLVYYRLQHRINGPVET